VNSFRINQTIVPRPIRSSQNAIGFTSSDREHPGFRAVHFTQSFTKLNGTQKGLLKGVSREITRSRFRDKESKQTLTTPVLERLKGKIVSVRKSLREWLHTFPPTSSLKNEALPFDGAHQPETRVF